MRPYKEDAESSQPECELCEQRQYDRLQQQQETAKTKKYRVSHLSIAVISLHKKAKVIDTIISMNALYIFESSNISLVMNSKGTRRKDAK